MAQAERDPVVEPAKALSWAVWTALHALRHMESHDLPDGVRLANQADKITYFLCVLREQGYDVVPLERTGERSDGARHRAGINRP